MKKFTSHKAILEKWKAFADGEPNGPPWFSLLANDIGTHLGPGSCTYFTVRRWWDRDNIPIHYHCALVKAARDRKIVGVTHEVLASIKEREHQGKPLRRVSSKQKSLTSSVNMVG